MQEAANMTNLSGKLLSAAALSAVVPLCASCNHSPKQIAYLKPGHAARGDEWLTWTPAERSRYVYGYLDGYGGGFAEACEAADDNDLFKEHVSPYPGDEDVVNIPLVHCRSHRKNFSKEKLTENFTLEIGSYPEILTQFYEEHPNCRSVPYVLLMGLLSDGQATTADELYKAQ
jgi:hypothetical protein